MTRPAMSLRPTQEYPVSAPLNDERGEHRAQVSYSSREYMYGELNA